jgi:hypothetical protein
VPLIKELQDIVDALGDHDEQYQQRAITSLLRVLDAAEQDIADSHLTWEERRAVWQQRIRQREQLRRSKFLAFQERVFGKAAADDLRAKYAKLDEEHRRRMRDLDRYLDEDDEG